MANLAPELIIDPLTNQADGNTTIFTTLHPYIPGTLTAYLNRMPAVHGKGIEEIPPNQFRVTPGTPYALRPLKPTNDLWCSYHA